MKKKILIIIGSIIVIAIVVIYAITRPIKTDDGAFAPSYLAQLSVQTTETNFDGTVYANPYKGGKLKILMLCTEEKNMTMENGKKFSTGNHPVETMVPMLHFKNAGFEVDVYTPTGKAVQLEMWAMPKKDKHVQAFYEEYKKQFESPKNLSDFVENGMAIDSEYIAIFIPGGHGAMNGLPDDNNVGKLVRWSHDKELFTIAICHGPAAFIAADLDSDNDSFIYQDYKIAAYPEAYDKEFMSVGYFPGNVPWMYGEKLEELGLTFVNEDIDSTTYIDRKLITGASPYAANALGKLAVTELLKKVNK